MCELRKFTKDIVWPGVFVLDKSLFPLTFGLDLGLLSPPELVISSHIYAVCGKKRPIPGHVDNFRWLDCARVNLSHPDVITTHRKVISSHASVTLAHFKPAFSLEKRLGKVLNCIKGLKRRSLSSGKPVDDFFESSSKPGAQYRRSAMMQNQIHSISGEPALKA